MPVHPNSAAHDYAILWRSLSPARRRSLPVVFLLTVIAGFAELMTIGAVIPFLALLAGLGGGNLPSWLASIVDRSGLTPHQAMLAATLLLAGAAVVSGLVRLAVTWTTQRFVIGAAREFGVSLYASTLRSPYPVHVSRNTSAVMADISRAAIISSDLLAMVQACGSMVIGAFIIVSLLLVNALVATVAGIGFFLIYAVVLKFSRAALSRHGSAQSRGWEARTRIANEGLGGIRDVILDRTHEHFLGRFEAVEREMEQARLINAFLGAAPRFIVEMLGIVLIAFIAFWLALQPGGLVAALPTLAALALGAQRLLPIFQSIYGGWVSFTTQRATIADLASSLETKPAASLSPAAPLPFDRTLQFNHVSFAYPSGERPAIRDATFEIRSGERVGIMGPSGSGKSTLMDLLLGLQEPRSGQILVDGTPLEGGTLAAWQRNVAHVPQAIYLADSSIAENIAFGHGSAAIDWPRLEDAARRSRVMDFVADLPEGLNTVVGERGVRLSGGQRQRIGIARALYKRAKLLVMDEATSALDHQTEAEVNQAIRELDRDLTMVIIAHRESSIAVCDRVLRVDGGAVAALPS